MSLNGSGGADGAKVSAGAAIVLQTKQDVSRGCFENLAKKIEGALKKVALLTGSCSPEGRPERL